MINSREIAAILANGNNNNTIRTPIKTKRLSEAKSTSRNKHGKTEIIDQSNIVNSLTQRINESMDHKINQN